MQDEEDIPRPSGSHRLGDDLTRLSVIDLEELIAALKAEIGRVEAERDRKGRGNRRGAGSVPQLAPNG